MRKKRRFCLRFLGSRAIMDLIKISERDMFDFLSDLDGYFCEKYANYDRLCVLPGYVMPTMQRSEVREDGRTYAYTLPSNTMRLALQEKKKELLAELKNRIADTTFSFSFVPYSFWERFANTFLRGKDFQ